MQPCVDELLHCVFAEEGGPQPTGGDEAQHLWPQEAGGEAEAPGGQGGVLEAQGC